MSNATPQGWLRVEFGDLFSDPADDIVDGPFGSDLKATEYVSNGIPIVRLQNIDRNKFVFKNIQYVTAGKAAELDRRTFSPGDILITKLGDPLGKACLSPSYIEKGVLVSDVVRARLTHEWVDRQFLCYQLNADQMIEQFKEQTKGTTRPRVNLTKIRGLTVQLCPLPEQQRIVEKLEELLSELDAGVVELKAAKRKLVHYRQALLKAAMEGALTSDWRAAHGKASEPGSELLQRILSERRARWEEKQLSRYAEQNKPQPKDWKAKYREPETPDLSDLPPLPDGWAWASLDQLSEIQGGIQKQPSRAPVSNRYPFLRVANVARGQLKLDEIHEIELFDGELARLALQKGDILIVEGNGSRSEIGRCALWDGSIENAVHQNHLIRARPVLTRGELIETWLNSPRGMEHMTALAATTSGLYTLSVGKISKIPVPLPPLNEQSVIVELLTEAIAVTAEQMAATDHSLKQAAAQRQNILKSAFSGKLVTQDPNDEQASALLARIRAEREIREKQPKARQPKQQKGIAAVIRKMLDVLTEADDWVSAQEIFRRCGIADGAQTDQIEALYAELRALEKAGRLAVEAVADTQGRKLHDRLKLQVN